MRPMTTGLCAAALALLSGCIDRMPPEESGAPYTAYLHQTATESTAPRIARHVQYRQVETPGGTMTIPPQIPILGWSAEIDFNDILARTLEGPAFQSAFLTVEPVKGARDPARPLVTASAAERPGS